MAKGTSRAFVRKVECGMRVEASSRTFTIVSDNLVNGVPVTLSDVIAG